MWKSDLNKFLNFQIATVTLVVLYQISVMMSVDSVYVKKVSVELDVINVFLGKISFSIPFQLELQLCKMYLILVGRKSEMSL